jgi:hypothetical protein
MSAGPALASRFPLSLAVAGLVWMVPLCAHAEDHDAAEIGHAIWFFGIFAIFFLGSMTLAVWLLVVRLRAGPSVPAIAPRYSNLESVWSRDPASRDSASPSSALPGPPGEPEKLS